MAPAPPLGEGCPTHCGPKSASKHAERWCTLFAQEWKVEGTERGRTLRTGQRADKGKGGSGGTGLMQMHLQRGLEFLCKDWKLTV